MLHILYKRINFAHNQTDSLDRFPLLSMLLSELDETRSIMRAQEFDSRTTCNLQWLELQILFPNNLMSIGKPFEIDLDEDFPKQKPELLAQTQT